MVQGWSHFLHLLNGMITLMFSMLISQVVFRTEPNKSRECFVICIGLERLEVQLWLKQMFEKTIHYPSQQIPS